MDSASATLRYAGHLPTCLAISRRSTWVPQWSHGTLSAEASDVARWLPQTGGDVPGLAY